MDTGISYLCYNNWVDGFFVIWTIKYKSFWLLVFFPFIQSFSVLAITPLFRLLGIFKYYSPKMFATISKRKIETHAVTSFDYAFVFKPKYAGRKWKKMLLSYYLTGLLNIITELKEKDKTDIMIEGASYFFNKKSVRKLGFNIEKPKIIQRVKLILNFFDQIWMYSLSNGKLSWPRLLKLKRSSIRAENLIRKEDTIKAWIERIENSIV